MGQLDSHRWNRFSIFPAKPYNVAMSKQPPRIHTFLIGLFAACICVNPSVSGAAEPPVVILKLDDFRPGGKLLPDGWQMTSDFLAERQIKSSYGCIGKDIVSANQEFCDWVRVRHESGLIEFWNHGYTHGKTRIDGQDVAEFQDQLSAQRESLKRTQDAGREKFGITFTAFGAPFNAINAHTATALESNDDLTIWLYGNARMARQGGYSGNVLPRVIDLEKPVHHPNYLAFRQRYEMGDLGPCIVLQGHPQSWASDPTRFQNFVQIIHFLRNEGCVFMTPSQYIATLKRR